MKINRIEKINKKAKNGVQRRNEGTTEEKTMSRNQACHPESRHVTEKPSKTKCLCMLTTTTKKQESQHNNLANP